MSKKKLLLSPSSRFLFIALAILLAIPLILTAIVNTTTFPYGLSNQNSIDLNKLEGIFSTDEKEARFNNKVIDTPLAEAEDPKIQNVLGDSDEEKRIEVDLTNQMLYAYEGDKKVMEFLVSTGKWGKTPTGEFRIWTKLRYTKMSGGRKELGTYYYLPNVPFTMFFANDEIVASRGFGIHGTYWHSNFGHPMSHGCINMKTEEAEQLYYWANPELGDRSSIRATDENPGTKVIIYGTAPNY